jgi:2-hydroxy-3-keto-5-methylthiopentenyl-1-phosphate phosphatase
MANIAIVWDFDGTLSPDDSTTKTVEILDGDKPGSEFWSNIKALRGDQRRPQWEHVLASDAPIWMYALSRLAFKKRVPLNKEFFNEFVVPKIEMYPNVIRFLRSIKSLQEKSDFREADINIHHFVVSAGLKELVELVFPEKLVTWTFGCRYTVTAYEGHEEEPESIPVFCMDETVKTRSLFEISKGSFNDQRKQVNTRVEERNLWAPFKNIVYIGDGPTDVPALSLVRDKGGLGVAVYNASKESDEINKRLKQMRLDKRTDLITPADFSLKGELYKYLETRCIQIKQRYEAEKSI